MEIFDGNKQILVYNERANILGVMTRQYSYSVWRAVAGGRSVEQCGVTIKKEFGTEGFHDMRRAKVHGWQIVGAL